MSPYHQIILKQLLLIYFKLKHQLYNVIVASLHVVSPPDIEPMVMNVTQGKNTTFKVLANFSDAKLQWLHNQTIVSSEGVTSMYTVVNATKMAGGTYTCNVSLPFGENIMSKEAQLFVCKN